MLVDLVGQVGQERLDVQTLQGVVDPPGHASQVRFLLQQVDVVALVGDAQGGGHPGHAPAHHEGRLVHRQVELLQGLEVARPGHGHPDDVFGLLGGRFLLLGVDPGAVLPDVGHVQVVLVETGLSEGVAEERLQGPRRAGRDDDPIEAVLLDGVGDLLGGVRRAGEELIGGVDHVRQGKGVLHRGGDPHDPADVGAAVAHEDADLGTLQGHVPLQRILALLRELPPTVVQELADLRTRRAGRDDRLGDVRGPLEASAHEDARSAGFHGVRGEGSVEAVIVELDAEGVRQAFRAGRGIQPHGQHHQVELFFLDPFILRGIPDGDVLGLRILPVDGHVAPEEPHPGEAFGPLVVPFEILAEGADVVVEDRALGLRIVFLGQDHLLLRVGAAHPRTVAVRPGSHGPRADALDPSHLARVLPVRGPPDLTLVRPGGAHDALVVHAGDDVLEPTVLVPLHGHRIERLDPG